MIGATTGRARGLLRVSGPAGPLSGVLPVPGDKSISNRAVLLGAFAAGTTRIRGFLPADDCLATLDVVRALGVAVTEDGDVLLVHGRGPEGLQEPERPLYCSGSGTTMRLLTGLLAGQPFYSILDGSSQLRCRPMARVAEPLRQMGATILGRRDGTLAPLTIRGGGLRGIDYTTPVASAQIKSAILIAGLFAQGETTVREPSASRDHTERLLRAMGVSLETSMAGVVRLSAARLQPLALTVPGDISSAAFFLAAGTMIPGSSVRLEGVGVNPTRTGALDVLGAMGAAVTVLAPREAHGEPVADLLVESRPLTGTRIGGALIPRLIDELPIIAVLATQADGVTEVRDAAELRVKETDRIASVVAELRKLGATIEPLADGFRIVGPTRLRGARVDSHDDHRLAMALAVAGLVADGETVIAGAGAIGKSFPGFVDLLMRLGAAAQEDTDAA